MTHSADPPDLIGSPDLLDSMDWDRLSALWDTFRELPAAERDDWLADLAEEHPEDHRQLRELLDHDQDDSFLERPVLADPGPNELRPNRSRPKVSFPWTGQQLGVWRLGELLGEGGMGAVYAGQRQDEGFEQKVAVKVLRTLARPDLERRLISERRILARLEHPNIARLIDGGTSEDGVPYVVMEYIDGCWLTDYLRDHNLGLRDTLRLFREVCGAVAYLHTHLVVHRDLKPANILVDTSGRPRVLDFGLARLLEADGGAVTETQHRALTPNYASPEQMAGGPITTASDVYALGVVLYELLTHCRPFELSGKSPVDIQRLLEGGLSLSTMPSRVARRMSFSRHQLRGDLDRIVLKAMSPEPARRYASVVEFADDLDRYLDGLPIRARGSTLAYRARKFLGRNRLASIFALLLLFALVGFSAVSWRQASRLRAERNLARQEQQRAEEAVELLEAVFKIPDPKVNAESDLQVRDLLEIQRRHVLEDLALRPTLQARLLRTLGGVYQDLGLFTDARDLLEKSFELRRELQATTPEEIAGLRRELGTVYLLLGEYEVSKEHLLAAVRIFEETLANSTESGRDRASLVDELIEALDRLISLYREQGELPLAEEALRRLLALSPASDPLAGARARMALAGVLQLDGDFVQAEGELRQALGVLRRYGMEINVASAAARLGDVLRNRNAYDEALPLLLEAREIYRRRLGPSTELGGVLNNLGVLLRGRGDLAEASEAYAEACDVLRAIHGEEQHYVAICAMNLGRLELILGKVPEARQRIEASFALFERLGMGEAPYAGLALHSLASVDRAAGDSRAALERSSRALAILRRHVSEDHLWIASAAAIRGTLLCDLGRLEEAEPLLLESLESRRRALGESAPAVADTIRRLARLRRLGGRLDEALELARRGLAMTEETLGADRYEAGSARAELADLLLELRLADESRVQIEKALIILRDRLPAGHVEILMAERIAAAGASESAP